MKKPKKPPRPQEMLDEYDFRAGVRGKFARRFAEGSNVVVLSDDLVKVFPDSEAVNAALHALVAIAQKSAAHQ